MDLITDSYSGELFAALFVMIGGAWAFLRKSINNFIDKVDKMDDHLTEIDKRLSINETMDKELKSRVNNLVEEKIRKYYEDKKGI